jgi:hypothetical protein
MKEVINKKVYLSRSYDTDKFAKIIQKVLFETLHLNLKALFTENCKCNKLSILLYSDTDLLRAAHFNCTLEIIEFPLITIKEFYPRFFGNDYIIMRIRIYHTCGKS